MTLEELQQRIELINRFRGDDERAHAMEDRLRGEVLHEIAQGCDNAKELAALVCTTDDIDFQRDYW